MPCNTRVPNAHGHAQAEVASGTQLFHGFVAELDSKLDHTVDTRVSTMPHCRRPVTWLQMLVLLQ